MHLLHGGLLALVIPLGLPSIALAQTTRTAVSAGAPAAFPNATGNFENTAVLAGQFAYSPSWAPWTMATGSGIASNASGFTYANPNAPSGTRVAFLQGTGSMSTAFTFTTGTWRLRFAGAQRKHPGVNRQVVRINIGTEEVFEQELTSDLYDTYTTRPVTFTANTTRTVTFLGVNPFGGDNTALLDRIEFERIGEWTQSSTWSPAGVPGINDPVVIPAGVEVAMRGTNNAAGVTVNGELIAAAQNTTLTARWVKVAGSQSRFEVGRELTPFLQNFTLLLNGTNLTDDTHAGTKFLMAMDGGTVDMHGIPKTSWARMTSLTPSPTVNPTSTVVRVPGATGWAVNDFVVVAYTDHVAHVAGWPGVCTSPYDAPKSRKLRIAAINTSTGDITLDGVLDPAIHAVVAPVTHTNPANGQQWTLEQRAEVGMLSHNVKVTGTTTANGLGAHVMIMACCTAMPTGFGRFANVELTEVGQHQILGRYPMHWHMVRGSGRGQYIRDCSVHKSHNRAITIHGSHFVGVERNVSYDVMGHAMFLEDGVERGNRFIENLVLATRKPAACQQMLTHDNSLDQAQNRSPASFWISNPDNQFIGNVAADSVGVGYWFALHRFATGLSATGAWSGEFTNTDATLLPLGKFEANSAHSIKMGIDVHDSVKLVTGSSTLQRPCLGPEVLTPCTNAPANGASIDIQTNVMWQPPTGAILDRFTAFGCSTAIYTGGGVIYSPKITFRNCVLADNGVHVQFASADKLQDSLLIHDSGNLIFPTGTAGPQNPTGNGLVNTHIHGYEAGNAYVVYDGPGNMANCYLVGYSGTTSGNFAFSDFGAARRHTGHTLEDLVFAGSLMPRVAFRDFSGTIAIPTALSQSSVWGITMLDLDGSMSGGLLPGTSVITNHPMLHLTTAGGASPDTQLGPTAYLSPFTWAHLQVRYYTDEAPFTMNRLLEMGAVPSTNFLRRAWQPSITTTPYVRHSFNSTFLPSAQMRQLPVIVRPAASTEVECVYEVAITDPTPAQTTQPLHRVDVSIDDGAPGVVTRLVITHATKPGWVPTVYINDDQAQVHSNGQHPSLLVPLPPGAAPNATSYTITNLNGSTAIDLRMVNVHRTHRISITWP